MNNWSHNFATTKSTGEAIKFVSVWWLMTTMCVESGLVLVLTDFDQSILPPRRKLMNMKPQTVMVYEVIYIFFSHLLTAHQQHKNQYSTLTLNSIEVSTKVYFLPTFYVSFSNVVLLSIYMILFIWLFSLFFLFHTQVMFELFHFCPFTSTSASTLNWTIFPTSCYQRKTNTRIFFFFCSRTFPKIFFE